MVAALLVILGVYVVCRIVMLRDQSARDRYRRRVESFHRRTGGFWR